MNDNLIFDTSSLNIKDFSETEFIEENSEKLSNILQHEFNREPQKQVIKKDSMGLNFACPFCGDSATDNRKKRGHFILRGPFAGNFKCFNCGKYMSIHNFFKNFGESMSLSSLTYITNNIMNKNISFKNNSNEITSEIFDKSTVITYAISRNKLKEIFGFIEISNNSNCILGYNYLINRCQYNFNNFLYDPKGKYIIILNVIDNDKVFGFQTRDITGKRPKQYRFQTFNLSRIYKDILKSDIEIPDNINALSTVFNIFNINIYKPILVTEGPMDAFLLPNCIATSGASKSIGIDLPFWFIYDSDKTGNEKAKEKLKEGFQVFLWNKLKNKLQLPYKKKWDINDVIIWCKENNYKEKIYWSEFFSNDKLDIIDI